MSIIILSAILIFVTLCHPAFASLDCSNQMCGDLNVRYPFSLTNNPTCSSFSSYFQLDCNTSSGKLYFNNTAYNHTLTVFEVIEINRDSLIVNATKLKAVMNNSACEVGGYSYIILPPFPGPYFISSENEFGSFGCTYGNLLTSNLKNYSIPDQLAISGDVEMGGCYVICPDDYNNLDCGNQTCCVSTFTNGSSTRYASYSVMLASSLISNFTNTCSSDSYASLFHRNHTNFANGSYHLKLNWALPAPTYQTTNMTEIMQSPDYACSPNANVTIVEGVPGYLCSCNSGYTGDGYLKGTLCTDINECTNLSNNDCIPKSTTCDNFNGSYVCKCKSMFYGGDGRRNGTGCGFSPLLRNAFSITSGILGLALLICGFVFLAIWWRKRTKRKYFMQNGGLEIQAYIGARGRDATRLFSAEELKAATNNYSDQLKLGVGGFGTVFKGTLEDGRVVAIKKANRGKDADNEQFLNEMAILTQINHRHIVRLLGCCLEIATPMLVYEYVSNGNVAENLASSGDGVMGWDERLKVARQMAEALAYLHAVASPPILHRDVKSTNVLLDDNLNAKVADFGVSRLMPDGTQHVSTAVQGTLGYLDPEYFQTLQLTHKSDVYSLGVVLVELITGLKPVDSRSREPRFTNLALFFIEHMREGRGEELIDPRLENYSTIPSDTTSCTRSSIMAVATLAHRCLALLGVERPSMNHVAKELCKITQTLHDFDEDGDETLPLLDSKQKYSDFKAGAVVAQNSEYYVQSCSADSTFTGSLVLNATTTMPR